MGSLGPTGRLDALASTSERSELLEVLQVLADRDRITRDLHEHVVGRLFGIGLTPAAGVLVLATTGDLDIAGHRCTVGSPSLPGQGLPGDPALVNGSEHGVRPERREQRMRETTAPSGVAATNGGGKADDDSSDRLGYVLDELSFPVHRWELIAAAQHYGADAATMQELHNLPDGRYRSLSEVINTVAEHCGQHSPQR